MIPKDTRVTRGRKVVKALEDTEVTEATDAEDIEGVERASRRATKGGNRCKELGQHRPLSLICMRTAGHRHD